MIDRILVPLDGSRIAEQIFPHLRRLLYRRDAEVILVRASAPPMTEDGLVLTDALQGAALHYLHEVQDRLEKEGVRVKSIARIGSPVEVLLEVAGEETVTMVAMATHGETGLKRLLVGSVAEAILKQSPVPVLVVRPFWSYELLPSRSDEEDLRPMRSILLPLDGIADCSVLVPPLVELARLFDAQVVLLHVLRMGGREGGPDEGASLAQAMALGGVEKAFQEQGIRTISKEGRGEAVHDILAAAREYEIDLIAMTSHGPTGFLGFFSNSVTEKVLHDSTCPMLVVRSAGREKSSHPASGTARKTRS